MQSFKVRHTICVYIIFFILQKKKQPKNPNKTKQKKNKTYDMDLRDEVNSI